MVSCAHRPQETGGVTTVKAYLLDHFGYKTSYLGGAVGVLIGYIILFGCVGENLPDFLSEGFFSDAVCYAGRTWLDASSCSRACPHVLHSMLVQQLSISWSPNSWSPAAGVL